MKNTLTAIPHIITFLCLLLLAPMGAYAADVRDIEQNERCRIALKGANLEDINALMDSNLVQQCKEGAFNEDLSVQMLSLLIGEPVFYLLESIQAMGFGFHTAKLDDPAFSVLGPMHDMLGAFNWLMFYTLMALMLTVFSVQMIRWARAEKEMGIMKWLNRNFSQNTIAMALCMPVLGWMTPIQVIAALFIMVVVYATKAAVTLFFAGLFLADTANNILDDITPVIEQNMMESVLIYRCDILRREDLINGIIASNNISSRQALEADPLYQCLQQESATSTSKGLSTGDLQQYVVNFGVMNNFKKCTSVHANYIKDRGLSPLTECGNVMLQIPGEPSKSDAIKEQVEQLFLSDIPQMALRNIAVTIHEYSCRFRQITPDSQLGEFSASCAQIAPKSGGYQFQWMTDPTAGKEIIARHLTPLTEMAKKEMRNSVGQSKTDAINHVVDSQSQLINLLRALTEATSQPNSVPSNEKDIEDTVTKINKGAWMTASLFVSKTANNIKDASISHDIGGLYNANSTGVLGMMRDSFKTLDTGWLLKEDLEPILGQSYFIQKALTSEGLSYSQSKIMGIILPEFGLYKNQLACWEDQGQCEVAALNPFISLGESGVKIFNHAGLGWTATTLMMKFSNLSFRFTGVKTKMMAVAVLNDFYILYIIIGIILAIAIPVYPVLKVLSLCTQWGLEVIKELAGLQLSMAFAPFSEPGKKVVTDDIRKALSRLVALSLYFMFIIVGVLVMFVTFSFLFSINILLLGGLSNIIQFTNGSHFLESVFLGVIFDVLVAVILFLEVKACSDLMDKVPGALAERFSLELSRGENIGDQLISQVKGQILPGVKNFMSNIR